ERYDPFVDTWSSPTRLNTPRSSLTAAVVGNRLITMGGLTYTPGRFNTLDVVEILDLEGL
ncbi:MAG TPA: kelch repeat-containing protein, partial [Gammaproteobacteria bacterium]|nr:kelch repeat-containing protein [Gammaproteobacteria bacterium]